MREAIWSFRENVGTVTMERTGLYWEYAAKLHTKPADFTRLYLHFADRSIRLGLFEKDGARLRLSGKISCRAVGAFEQPFAFTIQKEPFLPPEVLPDAQLPFSARICDGGKCYCIPLAEVDDRTLPYCCFFRPFGTEHVLLTLNPNGEPVNP